jgi:hypothetical protein
VKLVIFLISHFVFILEIYRVREPLTVADWSSVLKLSMMWKMGELWRLAIRKLNTPDLSPAWRVALGRKHGIADWITAGYRTLAERNEALSGEDFRLLGAESALKLFHDIRKPLHNYCKPATICSSKHQPHSAAEGTPEAVSRIFGEELSEQSSALSIVDRICLARTYGVSEWLHSEYVRLAERDEDITVEEAERLGLDTVAKICNMREKIGNPGHYNRGPLIHMLVKIDEIFVNELAAARADGGFYLISVALYAEESHVSVSLQDSETSTTDISYWVGTTLKGHPAPLQRE